MSIEELIYDRVSSTTEDVIPAEMAATLVEWLQREHTDDFTAWLHERAVATVADQVSAIIRHKRAQARTDEPKRAFRKAAEGGGEVAVEHVTRLLDARFCVNAKNVQRRMADMTAEDHRYVANAYEQSSRRTAMLAAFHVAVAKKCRHRKTGDVFSEGQLASLYESIVGKPSAVAA